MNKTEKFILADCEQFRKAFLKENDPLPNDDYRMKKADIFDIYGMGDRIYKNEYPVRRAEYVQEDGRIRIDGDGLPLGYVKKGSVSKFRNMLSNPNFEKMYVEVHFGKYLEVKEDYRDGDPFLESGESDFGVDLFVVLKLRPAAPATAAAPAAEPVKKNGLFSRLFKK